MKTKTHQMHRTKVSRKRYKRDLYKAWMFPTRFIREMRRWYLKYTAIPRLIWRVIRGKQRFVWDG